MEIRDKNHIDITDVHLIFDNSVEIGKSEELLAVAESINDTLNIYDARRAIIKTRDNINASIDVHGMFMN